MTTSTWRVAAGRLFDPVLAVVLLAACEIEVIVDLHGDHGHHHWPLAANVLVVAGLTVPLAWRRRAPIRAASVITICTVILIAVSLADVSSTNTPQFALFIPPYSPAAYSARRPAIAYLVAFLAAIGFVQVVDHAAAASWVFVVAASGFSWFVGRVLRARRELAGELARTTEQIIAERDAREQLAVADQRIRIASDLQTLVARSVSQMIVYARTARLLLDTDATRANDAMQTVETTGRRALTEMRRLLGVLRDPDQQAALAPQPGIGQIPALIERTRQAGQHVVLEVEGQATPVPARVDLAVYRIVEDLLGADFVDDGSPVEITVRFGANVELAITLGGRDDMIVPTEATRERIALCNGEFDVETGLDGRRRFVVRLPTIFDGASA